MGHFDCVVGFVLEMEAGSPAGVAKTAVGSGGSAASAAAEERIIAVSDPGSADLLRNPRCFHRIAHPAAGSLSCYLARIQVLGSVAGERRTASAP